MADLQSRLIIGAVDETASAFASVIARIEALQTKVAQVAPQIGAVANTAAPAPAPMVPAAAKVSREPEGFMGTVGAIVATVTGAKALAGGYQEAMAQQHERMRQEMAAMSPQEITKGEGLAAALAGKYPSIPESEIMHALRTARTVSGGTFEESAGLLEEVTKLRVIAQAARPHASNEEMTEEFDKLLKAMEIAGVTTDRGKFSGYMNTIAKSLNAFGDQVKPSDYFEQFKYSRLAGTQLSERFVATVLTTLGSEIGGASAGVAVQAFNRELVGGRIQHASGKALAKYGLVAPEDLETVPKTGEIKGIKPGRHVIDWRLAQTDPDKWILERLLPALEAHGENDPGKIQAAVSQIFQKGTAADLVGKIITQRAKFEKSANLWDQAKGISSADTLASKDAETIFKGAGNAIERIIASNMPVDMWASLTKNISNGLAHITSTPFRPDTGVGGPGDVSGWRGLEFGPLRIGNPFWSHDAKQSFLATNKSLSDAGYRYDDLKLEMARESSRGASERTASPPAPEPVSVSVSGQAQVDLGSVRIEIAPSPDFTARILSQLAGKAVTIPLSGDTGRMNGDAAPRRGAFHGVGH